MSKGKKILLTAAIIILVIFGASIFTVLPKSGLAPVELGDNASISPSDYLFGYPFVIEKAEIDVSEVDTSAVGEYTAHGKIFFYDYPIAVSVIDTTPPTVSLLENDIYIANDRDYPTEHFFKDTFDLSGDVATVIEYNEKQYDNIRFDDIGTYSINIVASDASGNISKSEVSFTVDTPPEIIGAFNRHIAVGTEFDPKKNVSAVDNIDGLVSSSITVDKGGLDTDKTGEYKLTYTAYDNYGLDTTTAVTIVVCEKKELSNYTDDISLTDRQMTLLCDAGYFEYEPLDEPDYDKTVSMIEPTLIDIRKDYGGGAWAAGSGCIFKITPQYTYFLSVKHVVKDLNKNTDIMFFDGAKIKETFDYISSENKNEISIFKIDTADIPTDTLLSLRQIYVDHDIYSKIDKGDEVVAYAKHWCGTDKDLIRPMKIKKMTSSMYSFGFVNSLLETTRNVCGGMSGTAVVDYRGRLVGLVSAGDVNSDYHSKIDCLKEIEEKIYAAA